MTPEEKQEIINAVISQLLSSGRDITGLDPAQSLDGISTFPAVLTTTNNGVTTKALVSVPISLLTQSIQDVITSANTAATSARSAAAGWAAAAVKMGSDIVVIEGDITNLQDADKSISTLTAYAECSTAANVSAKAVTVQHFALPTSGGCLHIKMEHANTAVSGVTLNINSTEAKPLFYNGSAVSATNTWEDNEVLEIYYDGTNYQATNAQGGGSGERTSYDNSESGLSAENVQEAIDELKENFDDVIGVGAQYEPITTTWVHGAVNGTTGEFIDNIDSSARSGFIQCSTLLKIQCGDDYFVKIVRKYSSASDSSTNETVFSSSLGNSEWDISQRNATVDCSGGGYYIVLIGKYSGSSVVNFNENESPATSVSKTTGDEPALDGTVVEKILSLQSKVDGASDEVRESDEGLVKNSGVFNAFSNFVFKPFEDYIFGALTTEKVEKNYSILNQTKTFGTDSDTKHCAIAVSAGEYYLIKKSGTATVYCFATSDTATSGGSIPLLSGTDCMTVGNSGKELVCIPQGCSYLLVYDGGNARVYAVSKMLDKAAISAGASLRAIKPLMMFEHLSGNSSTLGDFCANGVFYANEFKKGTYTATPRFIKTSSGFSFKANSTGSLRVFYFDENFSGVSVDVITYSTANSTIDVEPNVTFSYIKILFVNDVAFKKVDVELNGLFGDDWDVYNVRTSNGYHRICVMVDVSVPTCCDNITGNIQDAINLKPNAGVIALPETYRNTGKPTRLIIYCHGAGTYFTYNDSNLAATFDTNTHVDPAYWLKEGYAIMDVDGNTDRDITTTPKSDGTDAHAFRPQAMSAYVAAYQWAIEHYNLKRDGVLLGGRSMGAGNTMNLLRSTCPIPIIAACANHPTSVAMGTGTSAKLHIATIRGFEIPTGFTFSSGVMNDDDTQVFYDNWDKATRYTPSLALCVDVPTDEEWRKNFIKNCCHVGSPYESNRITACNGLHMVVKAPLKMFACRQDPNNGYQATSQLYMTMLGNAGQYAELRLFDSNKSQNYPSPGDSRSEHYYELADPTLRTTATTIYGEQVTNVPIVYVEMLQFWRRFEQRF